MWKKPLMQPLALTPHAQTRGSAVHVDARVRREPDGTLVATFGLTGPLSAVRIPPTGEPRRGHQLWRHTCFEVFVARDGTTEYHELNLAPSRQWAVFAFRAYRCGGPLDDETLAPRMTVRRDADRLELDALIPLQRLSSQYCHEPLRLALSAVVEACDGTLSYWALRHPPGMPDFHHADGFALRLERADVAC
jgi:hypothetical protein